jgi:superfamily I DNA and/or RNA helicase
MSFYCRHGVFGAGKSFLIAVIIITLHRIFGDTLQVLFSSNTNVAVDRVLVILKGLGFQDKMVRVGNIKKISKEILPFTLQSQKSNDSDLKELQEMLKSNELSDDEIIIIQDTIIKFKNNQNRNLLQKSFLVATTCIASAYSLRFENEKIVFPICILDECSQITEPVSLLVLGHFGIQRVLLIGDPKQLPPTLPPRTKIPGKYGLERTLFERLEDRGNSKIPLYTQYRCCPSVSRISNQLFYNNKLVDGVLEREKLFQLLNKTCFIDISGKEESVVGSGSLINVEEVRCIGRFVKVILGSNRLEEKEIGVISLYKAQSERIFKELEGRIAVNTCDAFQGAEKEMICLSTVRTKESSGFIDDPKRLNVALTRGRRYLVIFGSLNALKCNQLWKEITKYCQMWTIADLQEFEKKTI